MEFTTKLTIDASYLSSPNLVSRIDDDDLTCIGNMVVEDFERDKDSRSEWETRMDTAMKLALQVCENKTFPWQGAANVKFPLVTIAAIQYQSRAYPALVSGPNPVAARPLMDRPNPKLPPGLAQQAQQDPKAAQLYQTLLQQAQQSLFEYNALVARAQRISHHMSYQILEEDQTWEENQDRALLIQAIMGCVFKKTYFDPIKGHNISECVSPRELIVSYYSKTVETAPRLTHLLYLSSNDCYERAARGTFVEFVDGSPPPEPTLVHRDNQVADERQGVQPRNDDMDAPYEILEQHRGLDLDGDGYHEPYVITVRYDTKQVLRIVPRFTRADITWNKKGKIIRIDPIQAFTKYTFIPSPDGGFYDLGFGGLLGPINETIDSAINQLLDAGTLANAGGGFLGRGFRNKKGEYRFRPGEWKTVDSTGDDLRKNVMPLPTPQPNATLFQLLSLLIDYSESIAGATDILQGKNPGQNPPAETSRAMVEQGMKVFNGIYKRTHRAFTQELRKMFRLNTIYFSEDAPYYVSATYKPFRAMAKDYDDVGLLICPSADPFYMSDAQRLNQALAMREASMTSAGYDTYQVNLYYLEALKIPNPDRFLPDPTGPYAIQPGVDPKVQIEQMKQQTKQTADANNYKLRLLELTQSAEKLAAEIKKLEADSVLAMAQAGGIEAGHQIALLDAQIAAKKNHLDGVMEALRLLHEVISSKESDGTKASGTGGLASPSSNPAASAGIASAAAGIAGQMGGGVLPQ